MQAAVDAHRSQQTRRGGHGRSRSQHRAEGRGTTPHASTSTSTSASASVSVAPSVAGGVSSKAHSRAQSTARDRASASRAPSLPQSQAQSRTGSVQSSPKHTARGKRLPEDNGGVIDSAISGDANRSMRSSMVHVILHIRVRFLELKQPFKYISVAWRKCLSTATHTQYHGSVFQFIPYLDIHGR